MAVTGLGVFTTAIAGVGYVFLIKRQGPVFMSMAIYLAPLWATAVGVVLLGERPGWPAYAALALILLGVGLATSSDRKLLGAAAAHPGGGRAHDDRDQHAGAREIHQ